jgi:hypothetical protein
VQWSNKCCSAHGCTGSSHHVVGGGGEGAVSLHWVWGQGGSDPRSFNPRLLPPDKAMSGGGSGGGGLVVVVVVQRASGTRAVHAWH